MGSWGNTDDAANSVFYAPAQFNVTANTDNQTLLFDNVTEGDFVANLTVGQFGVTPDEAAAARAGLGRGEHEPRGQPGRVIGVDHGQAEAQRKAADDCPREGGPEGEATAAATTATAAAPSQSVDRGGGHAERGAPGGVLRAHRADELPGGPEHLEEDAAHAAGEAEAARPAQALQEGAGFGAESPREAGQ